MRRPSARPTLDVTVYALMRELFAALDAAFVTYATLTERRDDRTLDEHDRAAAVAAAKRLSAYTLLSRRVILTRFKPAEIFGVWLPARVFEASGRFAYALTAIGEPDPEPEALLSRDELDEVIDQYDLRRWLEAMRSESGPVRLDQTP